MGSTSFSNKVVGIFNDATTVDSLLNDLNNNGFDKADISVLARDYNSDTDVITTRGSAVAYPDAEVRDLNETYKENHDVYPSGVSGSDIYPRGTIDPTFRGEDTTVYSTANPNRIMDDYPSGTVGSNRFGAPDNSATARLGNAMRHVDDKIAGRDILHNDRDYIETDRDLDDVVEDRINEERDFDDKHQVAEKDPKAMVKGATAGGAIGLIAGLGMLLLPGIGPVLAAGPLAAAITAAAGGAAIGATAGTLVGVLNDEGIPNDRAEFYNRQFNKGNILVMVHTDEARASLARQILVKYNPETVDSF